MSLFEAEVVQLKTILEQHPSTRLAIATVCAAPKGLGAGLILQHDAWCELGGPTSSSAAMTLWSSGQGQDQAFLIGHNIDTASISPLSLAQITILYGSALSAEMYYQFVQRFQRLVDHPGWMTKTAKGRIWVRAASQAGTLPSLAEAAKTLIVRTKESFPAVEAVEIWYVVGQDHLISELAVLADTYLQHSRNIKEEVWKERGFDYESCRLAGHCGSCSDKKTCASVRGIEAQVRIKRRRAAQNTNKEC